VRGAIANSLLSHFRFRHLDPFKERWAAIEAYNQEISSSLPGGARELVNAEWHYNFNDPCCPHDSWLKSIQIEELTAVVGLSLLGAFHDRILSFE
jgi:hypothetical protein